MTKNFTELATLVWQVHDVTRGGYRRADYRKAILPFTLLTRLDCVLGTTKGEVVKQFDRREAEGVTDIDIEGNAAPNNNGSKLLKEERIFAAMHGMSVQLVRRQFKAAGSSDAR